MKDKLIVRESLKESAGWIAIWNGKKCEIGKDEAKDLWGAKQLAIKKLGVPKSKVGELALDVAFEDGEDGVSNAQFEGLKEELINELHNDRRRDVSQFYNEMMREIPILNKIEEIVEENKNDILKFLEDIFKVKYEVKYVDEYLGGNPYWPRFYAYYYFTPTQKVNVNKENKWDIQMSIVNKFNLPLDSKTLSMPLWDFVTVYDNGEVRLTTLSKNYEKKDYYDQVYKNVKKNESLKEEKEEPKLETFDEQMDFLAKDEQEAIDGYEKVLALVEDEHVKEQLEKILVEERAHKEFLEKVKEDHSLEYSHEEHEEEKEEMPAEVQAIEESEEIEVVVESKIEDNVFIYEVDSKFVDRCKEINDAENYETMSEMIGEYKDGCYIYFDAFDDNDGGYCQYVLYSKEGYELGFTDPLYEDEVVDEFELDDDHILIVKVKEVEEDLSAMDILNFNLNNEEGVYVDPATKKVDKVMTKKVGYKPFKDMSKDKIKKDVKGVFEDFDEVDDDFGCTPISESTEEAIDWNSLDEEVEEAHVCEKCGKEVCECDKLEETSKSHKGFIKSDKPIELKARIEK